MKLTKYERVSPKVTRPYKLVMLSDVHNKPFDMLIAQVAAEQPDAILVVGDIVDRHRKTYKRALPFLKACAQTAPTFFSYGNHEIKFPKLSEEEICETGVVLLDNSFIRFGDLLIGGHTPYTPFAWLSNFEQKDGYKILLNHHPEYFYKEPDGRKNFTGNPGLRDHGAIDLILSGHAHGGQWRLGNRGVLAPGQGLMAKYVRGEFGHMIVGTGVANTATPLIPRFFNPREIVEITLRPE
ncbi:MAG: metallophosphoesterase [Clostridia bacterium]|nr:metallophosphoesterase [Clostridia bacterium]